MEHLIRFQGSEVDRKKCFAGKLCRSALKLYPVFQYINILRFIFSAQKFLNVSRERNERASSSYVVRVHVVKNKFFFLEFSGGKDKS